MTALLLLYVLAAFNTLCNLLVIASFVRSALRRNRTIAAYRTHDAAEAVSVPAAGATFVFPIDEDMARTPARQAVAMAATTDGPGAENYYRLSDEGRGGTL